MANLISVPTSISKWIPPAALRLVEKRLGLNEVNLIQRRISELATEDSFFSVAVEALGLRFEHAQETVQRIPASGPLVLVANHPHGIADGLILGAILNSRRPDTRIMANSMLQNLQTGKQRMFFVNLLAKTASAKYRNAATILECAKHVERGGAVVVFPGTKVSHYQWSRWGISDSAWASNVGGLIRITKATVIPVFIRGHNSSFFNIAGLVHPTLRTALLPRELLRLRQLRIPIHVRIGEPVPFSELSRYTDRQVMCFLRSASEALNLAVPVPSISSGLAVPN